MTKTIAMMRPDSPDLRARLAEDGVVLLEGVLDDRDVVETRAALHRYRTEVLPAVPRVHNHVVGGEVRAIDELQQHDPWFQEFGARECFLRIFRAAVAWEPMPFFVETFIKRPGCGPQPLHQDIFAGPVDPPQYLHLWIALQDVGHANSGMVFYRGSHRFGLAPHVFGADGLPAVDPLLLHHIDHLRAEPEIPAGSAALFGCTMIHGSKPNVTSSERQAVVVAVRGRGTTIPGDLDVFESNLARLYREEVGGNDVRLDLAGVSAADATRLADRVSEMFGVVVTPSDLRRYAGLGELAAHIHSRIRA